MAAIVFAGCSGVTPSIKVGLAHQLPADTDEDDYIYTASAWTLGGSFKASFPESGPVIEPCGIVGYTHSVTESDDGDFETSATGVPTEFCVEVDTAKLRR